MDSRSFTAGNYLGGESLTDKEKDGLALEVSDVTSEEMRSGSDKLCLHFKEDRKPLLLNKTNSKRMASMYGHETDDWIGEVVNLWFDPEVEYMGDIVGGIRVRISTPAATEKKR